MEQINKMIDIDNMTSMLIPRWLEPVIRKWIEDGEILDCCAKPLVLADCLDLNGDLCVDEDAYVEIKDRLQL